MAFVYFEVTRRQLADNTPSTLPDNISKQERMKILTSNHNSMGDVTVALNELGAVGWELVSVTEARSYGAELLYTFKKTI